MLIVWIFFLLSKTFAYFIVTQLKQTPFEQRYLLHDQVTTKTNILIISCKQYQVLSLKILPEDASEEQYPKFNISRPIDRKAYQKNSYTFIKNCHVDIDVNNKDSLIVVKRKQHQEVLFEIRKVSFSKGHNIFETVDNSQIFGLGERFQQHFDVRDGTWALWNRDRPRQIDNGKSNKSAQTYGFQPLYLARQKISKLFHITFFKTVFAMNVIKNGQKITYNIIDGNAHFLIFIGSDNPQLLLQKYHQFIGPSLIPPFWSLGYHQCRWGYKNINDLQQVIKKHQLHKIPIDTIWNDLEYMYSKIDFTIDEQNFPLSEMKNKILSTVHYIPLIDAGIAIQQNKQFSQAFELGNKMNVFIKYEDHNYIGSVWPGKTCFVDFLHPNGSYFWNVMFGELYQKIKFSGVWLDMNEIADFSGIIPRKQFEIYKVQHNQQLGMMTIDLNSTHFNKNNFLNPLKHIEVHSYYGHLMTQSTHRFLQSKGLRPFIITRSNSVGTGMYGGHWTGDNVADWNFLRLSISGNFLYQIFGIHMVGSDICGFNGQTTAQLCSRWMQLGAFYPFARNHNQINYRGQQVYALGDDHLQTSKLSLDLRYSLLKQYYSAFIKTQGKGSIYRPLIFEFPNDQNCYQLNVLEEQFMIGDFLMGTPIVQQGIQSKIAYFPQGWFDYFDGSYKTQKVTIRNVLPSSPSIFIRQGKIIFINNPKTRTKYLDSNFTMKIAFKKTLDTTFQSQGYIMSINDYQNNQKLQLCIQQGCFYKINAVLIQEKILLKWEYSGSTNLSEIIMVSNLQVYQEGKEMRRKQVNLSFQTSSKITIEL